MSIISSKASQPSNRSFSWRSLVLPFLGAATVGGALAAPTVAQAWWTRTQASACADTSGTGTGNSNYCNTSTAFGRHLSCPVPDTNATPKTGINQFNVHVTESTPDSVTSVMRCVRFRDAVGGKCGNLVTTSSSGIQNLNPPTFAEWGQSNNYGYIFVALAKATAATESCIQGYFTSDVAP